MTILTQEKVLLPLQDNCIFIDAYHTQIKDENNKNGCSLTIKVPSNKVKTEWDKLILNSITENLRLDKEDYKKAANSLY